jgi:Protein of unknown function (DUF3257).
MISDNFQKGELACLKVEQIALEKGYIVSKPTIEGTRYDRIIDCNNRLYRVQIKYAGTKQTNSEGCICIDLRKKTNSGKKISSYNRNEVDVVLAYIPEIDKVCWFEPDLFEGKQTLTIRYEPSKNGQVKNIIFAENYIWN